MSDVTIPDNGPFVSILNEAHLSAQKRLHDMGYLGQSQDRKLYWNKGSFSLGLLCGSSVRICQDIHVAAVVVGN